MRLTALPDLLAEASQARNELVEQLASMAEAEGESPELAAARRALLEARIATRDAELGLYEAELEARESREGLFDALEQRNAARLVDARARLAEWEAARGRAIADEQARAAARAAEEAERLQELAAREHSAIRLLADENKALVAEKAATDADARQRFTRLEELRRLHDRLIAERAETGEIMEVADPGEGLGRLLRTRLQSLPDLGSLRSERRELRRSLAAARDRWILVDLELEASLGLEGELERVLRDLPEGMTPEDVDAARAVARRSLEARSENLARLVAAHEAHLVPLEELVRVSGKVEAETAVYRGRIHEGILWMPSSVGGWVPDPGTTISALAWLFSPSEWGTTLRRAWTETVRAPGGPVGILLLWVALVLTVRNRGRILGDLAKEVGSTRTDSIRLTLVALVVTALRAAPAPAALLLLGSWLARPPNAPVLAGAFEVGLATAAAHVYPLLFLDGLLCRCGIGEAHFRWPKHSLATVRKNLRWFVPTLAVMAFLVTALEGSPDRERHPG